MKNKKYLIGILYYDGTPGSLAGIKSRSNRKFGTKEEVRKFIDWLSKKCSIENNIEEVLNNGGLIGGYDCRNKFGYGWYKYYLFLSIEEWEKWYKKVVKWELGIGI